MTRITEWALGIIGAIAAFMGLFVLYAPGNQYVGIGGDLSWRVGDIAPAWGPSLLIGGAVLVAGAVALAFWGRRHPHETEEQSDRASLVTHAIVFALVNAFLWLQDIAIGGGIDYAYWITIPWGIGLTAHAIVYFTGARHAPPAHPAR